MTCDCKDNKRLLPKRPTNGDLAKYNGISKKWELINISNIGGGGPTLKRGANFSKSVSDFPTTGGTGAGGAIKANDCFFVTSGTPGYGYGTLYVATIDNPGTSAENWFVLQTNLGFEPINLQNIVNAVDEANPAPIQYRLPSLSLLVELLGGKVNTEAGKSLMTDEERTKLNAIYERYKGRYPSLVALQTAWPVGQSGWEALVDPGPGSPTKVYLWDDTDNDWVLGGGISSVSFAEVSGSPGDNAALLALFNTKQNAEAGKGLSTNDFTNPYKSKLDNAPANTNSELSNKVDKVTGKGLSTNDFDATAKSKVDNLALDANATYETKLIAIDNLDANYTPVAGDLGRWKRFTGAVTRTITLPSDATLNLPIGFNFKFSQAGIGMVQWVAGAGATVNAADSATKNRVQHSPAEAIKVDANTWLVVGDITV